MIDITSRLTDGLQWWHSDCKVRVEARKEIEHLRSKIVEVAGILRTASQCNADHELRQIMRHAASLLTTKETT